MKDKGYRIAGIDEKTVDFNGYAKKINLENTDIERLRYLAYTELDSEITTKNCERIEKDI